MRFEKKFLEILLFGATIFAFPTLVKAEIRINEVAWMGTSGSQYEEWIELYNDGGATSLQGFQIYKAGGSTLLINLSGNISAGEYFLVCRTTASVPNPLSGSCQVNGSFGGSGLSNAGEHLILKDNSGSTIDSINGASGWPAGESASKQTMQLSGNSWITETGTPGAVNATGGSGGGNNNGNENNNDEEEEQIENVDPNEVVEEEIVPKIYSTRLLKVEYPKLAIVGSPAHFRAQALDYDRSDIFKGHYKWNMGDGTTREFALGFRETNNGFDYAYEHPGTYSVNVRYYHSFFNDVPPDLEENFVIEVTTATISISKIYADGSVELKNMSGSPIDLSGWQLRDNFGKSFIFPDGTKIIAGKTSVFPARVTKLNTNSGVNIFTPTNSLAATNIATKNYFGSRSSAKEAEDPIASIGEKDGEVLGATVVEPSEEKPATKERGNGMVWILAFVILILVAVIAVMFLRKDEKTEEGGYELIDE